MTVIRMATRPRYCKGCGIPMIHTSLPKCVNCQRADRMRAIEKKRAGEERDRVLAALGFLAVAFSILAYIVYSLTAQ